MKTNKVIVKRPKKFSKSPTKQNKSKASSPKHFDNVDKVLQNKNIVLCEGEVMRFKPGIQKDFISRWLQLTPISLQYYENRTKVFRASPEDHYFCGPLMSVPIDAIEIVQVPDPGSYEI